jgi:hypothetical protein
MAYYLMDDDRNVALKCKTIGMRDHLLKNGCRSITQGEFKLWEDRYYQKLRLEREMAERLTSLIQCGH